MSADIPKEFLQNSQGPALALAVSQMIPSTENVDEVISMGFVPDEVTDDDVLGELKKARDGGSVTPEVLVPYIEACPQDDEVDYNLFRYELNRQQACEEAIAVIEEELREFGEPGNPEAAIPTQTFYGGDPGGTGEQRAYRVLRRSEAGGARQRVLGSRLQEARGAARDASGSLNRYAERLRRSADPVVRARVGLLMQSERPRADPDGPGGQQPPRDYPAPSAWYGPEPGAYGGHPYPPATAASEQRPADGGVPPTRPEQIRPEVGEASDGIWNLYTRPSTLDENPEGPASGSSFG